jgi:hypothetical protein
MGTIPQKNKTGNEKRSCCSAAHLFYPFSTSQNLEVKSAVKMVDYKTRNWLDRYVFGCFFIAGFAPLWDCTPDTGEEKNIDVYFDSDNDPKNLVEKFKNKLKHLTGKV